MYPKAPVVTMRIAVRITKAAFSDERFDAFEIADHENSFGVVMMEQDYVP